MTRRRVLVATLLALVAGVSSVAPLAGALDPVTTASDDRVVLDSGRAYVLHTPPLLRRTPRLLQGRPAMIVLHGLTSNPADTAGLTGLDELSDRDGALLAYPEGVRKSFNAGLCCGQAVVQEVDDVAFLTTVVEDLRRRGAGRISVVGFSNGAMMAYRFACTRPDLVDTVGVVAGTLEIPKCTGKIRALHLHGADDDQVPYDGADYSKRLKAYLRPVPEIAAAAPGSTIVVKKLEGFGHDWPDEDDALDASEELWRFARMADAT